MSRKYYQILRILTVGFTRQQEYFRKTWAFPQVPAISEAALN